MTAALPLPAQKSSTERQLELTLNALARSMRKAIRLAEKCDAGGIGEFWKVVEHRCELLQKMMAAAAQFMQAQRGTAAPTPEPEHGPAPTPSSAHTPAQNAVKSVAQPTASQSALDPRLARFANLRLQNLEPVGSAGAPAPEVDPRVRLLQLLTSSAIALQK